MNILIQLFRSSTSVKISPFPRKCPQRFQLQIPTPLQEFLLYIVFYIVPIQTVSDDVMITLLPENNRCDGYFMTRILEYSQGKRQIYDINISKEDIRDQYGAIQVTKVNVQFQVYWSTILANRKMIFLCYLFLHLKKSAK